MAGLSKIRSLASCHRAILAVNPRELVSRLGVRYLVEGTVRTSDHRVRDSAGLIDGATGAQVWSASFDAGEGDMLDLQERFAEQIVGEIEPSIRHAEIERVRAESRPNALLHTDLALRVNSGDPQAISIAAFVRGEPDEEL